MIRKKLTHIVLAVACLLAGTSVRARAEGDPYDAALDRYLQICNRVIDLKCGIRAGEKPDPSSLESLSALLIEIKETLASSSGSMSPEQRARFRHIHSCFVSGRKAGPFSFLPDVNPIKLSAAAESDPDDSLRRLRPFPQKSQALAAGFRTMPRFGISAVSGTVQGCSAGLSFFALWKKGGFYCSARTSPFRPSVSYGCLSDGTSEGGFIWASGRSRVLTTAISAGGIWNAAPWLHPYAGAGYSRKSVAWEDISHDWAKVSDLSGQGLMLEAGVTISLGRMLLSVGCPVSVQGDADLCFGVGLMF